MGITQPWIVLLIIFRLLCLKKNDVDAFNCPTIGRIFSLNFDFIVLIGGHIIVEVKFECDNMTLSYPWWPYYYIITSPWLWSLSLSQTRSQAQPPGHEHRVHHFHVTRLQSHMPLCVWHLLPSSMATTCLRNIW